VAVAICAWAIGAFRWPVRRAAAPLRADRVRAYLLATVRIARNSSEIVGRFVSGSLVSIRVAQI
jgi:hypothetical protein